MLTYFVDVSSVTIYHYLELNVFLTTVLQLVHTSSVRAEHTGAGHGIITFRLAFCRRMQRRALQQKCRSKRVTHETHAGGAAIKSEEMWHISLLDSDTVRGHDVIILLLCLRHRGDWVFYPFLMVLNGGIYREQDVVSFVGGNLAWLLYSVRLLCS